MGLESGVEQSRPNHVTALLNMLPIKAFSFGKIDPPQFINEGPTINEKPARKELITLASQLYEEIKRKASGDPYLKHPLRALVLLDRVFQAFQQDNMKLFDDDDHLVLEATALFHDVLEIKRPDGKIYQEEELKKDLRAIGIEEELAERIVKLVKILTPPP